jgi:hypothetical protein
MSPVELRRILGEWRLRVQRVKDILQPSAWTEKEWRQFSQALALLVRDHGKSWIIDPNVYWDLRWKLQDGGELVCQVEHIPDEKTSLVVAQTGGFVQSVESYTWLWAEFDLEGEFSRDPYWVDGTWKDALTTLLLPLDRQSSFLLAGRATTPDSLLLQEGARPNDGNFNLALPAGYSAEEKPDETPKASENPPAEPSTGEASPAESSAEKSSPVEPAVPDESPPVTPAPAPTPLEATTIPAPESPPPEAVADSPPSSPAIRIKAEPAFILSEREVRFRRLRARTRYALTQRRVHLGAGRR